MRIRLEKSMIRIFCDGAGECAYAVFALRGPELSVESPSDWHEHRRVWIRVGLVLMTVAFSLPWYGKVPPDDGQCSGPHYGFAFHDTMLWIYTGKSTGAKGAWITIPLPWMYKHVRHSWLCQDGSIHHDATEGEFSPPLDTLSKYPYVYKRLNGEIQERTATINGEEREYRLHYAPWLPWPRKIMRSIDIQFSDEVGERTGSWKGGTIGCGWTWLKGETQEQALHRMEKERQF